MREFQKAYNSLNAEQKTAVDKIYGPILVIAGPGTGKTQLLATRVANILKNTDALPQNILCLTFTDSAAHSMRERLTTIIGQEAFDVSISTYHSFGSELIRRFPDYFSDSLFKKPIDELEVDSILRDILSNLAYSNSLKSDYFLADINSLIKDCKRCLIDSKDIKFVYQANKHYFTAINKIVAKLFPNDFRVSKKNLAIFDKLLLETLKIKTNRPKAKIKPISEIWLNSLSTALELSELKDSTVQISKWKNKWLSKNSQGEFIVKNSDNTKLLDFSEVFEKYTNELAKRNIFDYNDMITKAVDGLKQHPDLRYSLQEQYQFILLDEFQDTNVSQFQLIQQLSDNPVNEGQPNILAVGDDDQAIYSFQGANFSNMKTFENHFKDVLVITLHSNYRSTNDIVEFSEKITDQIEDRIQNYFPGMQKSLTAVNKLLPGSQIERDEFKSDLAQYNWISSRISYLIKQGALANEIAVLAPKHKYLEPMVPYLHHAGISVRYEKRENVLDDPAITLILRMSKLILNISKNDVHGTDQLWPEILSADFWNLPTELIWNISWDVYDRRSSWGKELIQHPETKPIFLFFYKLSTLAGHETLELILDQIIGVANIRIDDKVVDEYQSPFYDFYFGEKAMNQSVGDFWLLLSNLTVLRQHLRDYNLFENKFSLTLEDFIGFVEKHNKAQINIINTSPYYESLNAVQLMTVYKAKGQEFNTVFILGCLDEVWGERSINRPEIISLPANLNFIRPAGKTTDEKLRLFYVAITRAKSRLYMTSYLNSYSARPMTRLRYLSETIQDNKIISPYLPKSQNEVHVKDITAPELVTLKLYWEHKHLSASSDIKLQSLLEKRLKKFQLSPTHVSQFTDVINDGPKNFLINSLLRFPRSLKPSAQYGTAMHETLQWVHAYNASSDKLPSHSKTVNFFKTTLENKLLSFNQYQQLLQRGKSVLDVYLKSRSHTINKSNLSEFNFKREGVFVKNAHLTGSIDKLIIDKDKKQITVVDYKTGKSYQNWENNIVLHKYRQQLYAYKLLLEGSHTFSSYKVSDAYLEFIEPDSRGLINELHLKFDHQEQNRIAELMSSIWLHVLDFSFPSVSEYAHTIAGINKFEDYLIKDRSLNKKVAPFRSDL